MDPIKADLLANIKDQKKFEKISIKFLKKLKLIKESAEDQEDDSELNESLGSNDELNEQDLNLDGDSSEEQKSFS